jgi:glycosyltransferase involved in cell wall biosynthesis
MSGGATLHACTTTTRAQLPSVRVLFESLRSQHPDAELTVLLLDGSYGAENGGEDFPVVSPDALGMPPDLVAKLVMACTASELSDALTPRLVRFLVERGAPALIALSPETEVFAPLDHVVELAVEHGIVLVPRLDASVPDDGLEPDEAQVQVAGPFASGFVAVGADADGFLDWWCDRQQEIAFSARGFAGAGPWTALAPAFFPVHVLRELGYGVSAWNLLSREIREANGGYEDSGAPLRWFDFSGYSPEAPHLLSTEFKRPRVRLSDQPALARLCDEHGTRLRAGGYDAKPPTYGYDVLPDGKEIDARMRRMYADALRAATEQGQQEPPSPFGSEGADAFVAWVKEPVAPPDDPRVSRYLARVREENLSVFHFFPSLEGEGAEQYIASLRHSDEFERETPGWVQPTDDEVLQLIKRRWRTRPIGPRPHGVNLVGYVTAVLGVGQVARLLAPMLDRAGVPKVVVANRETSSEQTLAFDSGLADEAPYDVNLLCVNADHTTAVARQLGPEFFANRRTVGVWFWEVEDFPPSSMDAFDLVDEIWVATDFVLEAIAPVSPKPVRKFPLPVVVPSPPAHVTRSQVGMPDDRFVFLFVYDFLSTAERKNPVGLIEAYTRAFGPNDGTTLVLKSINGDKRLDQLERVRRAAEGRPDVVVRDAYLSPELHSALLAHCDAYVSLHRSEGFGLDMAHAMGLGKPVIATGYSGNREFMDDATSYLVDYELGPVGPGSDPYPADSRWAYPNVDHAAELLRRVVERPEEAQERGRRAAGRIRTEFSIDARSAALAPMVNDARARGGGQGSWRRFFMEGWRSGRGRVEDLPYGALDWLPDGTAVDEHMRGLLTERTRGPAPPDPEVDLTAFYDWLNERVFPTGAPVVSRYLYQLWLDRPDLQSHFPSLDPNPRDYLEWLVQHGHADTDIPYQLLPTHDDVVRLNHHEELQRQQEELQRQRQERRAMLVRALRRAGQRVIGLVKRR